MLVVAGLYQRVCLQNFTNLILVKSFKDRRQLKACGLFVLKRSWKFSRPFFIYATENLVIGARIHYFMKYLG
jgi:hypothetical protein